MARMHGRDALVSIVGDAGTTGGPSPKTMIDAVIAAGVNRFLTSNFGSHMANPDLCNLPVFAHVRAGTRVLYYSITSKVYIQLNFYTKNRGFGLFLIQH